jgi:hypothetical protein
MAEIMSFTRLRVRCSGALAETILPLDRSDRRGGKRIIRRLRRFIKKFPLKLSVQSVTSVVLPILRVYSWKLVRRGGFVASSFFSGICGAKFSKIF